MNKEEIERYKIRDYYMIPVEIVDSIFYSFEQKNQKYKEVIDKAIEILKLCNSQCAKETIDILKEVE